MAATVIPSLEQGVVKHLQLSADSLVQFVEAMELAFAKRSINLAVGVEHRALDRRLVAWLSRPGGHHCCVVMHRELGEQRVDYGLVTVGLDHATLEIVAQDAPGNPAIKAQCLCNPVAKVLLFLGGKGHREGVSAVRQDANKDFAEAHLARLGIHVEWPVACEVHHHHLAGMVLEPHRHLFELQYRPHMLAKLRVPMTVRMGHAVLGPELLPGHTLVAQVGKCCFKICKQRCKSQSTTSTAVSMPAPGLPNSHSCASSSFSNSPKSMFDKAKRSR